MPSNITCRALSPTADYTLLSTAVDCAKARNIEMHVGNLLCSDAFYNEGGMAETVSWAKMGTLAVEMESTALYLRRQGQANAR